MNDWLEHLIRLRRRPACGDCAENDCVLISTLHTQGSCPREAGTRMLVTHTQCIGTIGGGRLELQAIEAARACLQTAADRLIVERYALGARLGQCCGGSVQLAFEYIRAGGSAWIDALAKLRESPQAAILITPDNTRIGEPSSHKLLVTAHHTVGCWDDTRHQALVEVQARKLLDNPDRYEAHRINSIVYEVLPPEQFPIAVFGAGHVGKALVQVLSALPCHITWIDSRAEQFPDTQASHITRRVSDFPEDEIDVLPPGCHVFIMTHDHAVDLRVCEASLKSSHLASCALIGSATKRTLFERRLRQRGISHATLDKLICPIGLSSIDGKHPAEIAIAVAAELLQSRQQRQPLQESDEKVASCP